MLRALERAQRIQQAMIARGFDGELRSLRKLRRTPRDTAFVLGWGSFFVLSASSGEVRVGDLSVTAAPDALAMASATISWSSDQEVVVMDLPLAQPSLQRADFLAWEADQSGKHEFLSGEVFAMVGAHQEHVVVSLALAALLREHLRGTRCRA